MPGMAFVRDEDSRAALIEDWAALICNRDLSQFKSLKLDGDLAMELIRLSATLEEPTVASFARMTRANTRTVQKHCNALEQLFVFNRLAPFEPGRGKPLYLLLDSGIAAHFGATLRRQLQVLLLNERLCCASYTSKNRVNFHYYRSRKKNIIDVVEKNSAEKISAFQIIETERFSGIDFELMRAFAKDHPKARCVIYAPITESLKIDRIEILPWERLAVEY
jgi:predicted AAA+ superfamily ATPase